MREGTEEPLQRGQQLKGLIEGRIVHFVMPGGQHRPAIVVHVWPPSMLMKPGYVNLTVFTDWSNDGVDYSKGIVWETSVDYSEEPAPRTWHWPERTKRHERL